VPGLGTSFGRGGATTAPSDLANADAILIMGSSMAENHPVGFQWVIEARERGATIIHVDPRFNRTSAMADLWVPLRAGSDIVFLGGMVRYALEEGKVFRDYVASYTNATVLLKDELRDAEDLDGLFSGWDERRRRYDPESWLYRGTRLETDGAGDAPGHQPEEGGHGKDRGGEAQDLWPEERDPTMEDPRCVYQVLRRHFARYTPAMVERACGVPAEQFRRVAEAFCAASGPEKTGAICYAGRAGDPHRGDPAAAARQRRASRRRHHGAARPRLDPGLHRHSHALRHPARLPDHAVLRERLREPRRLP
jgi:formate dehydrogenase major subunit